MLYSRLSVPAAACLLALACDSGLRGASPPPDPRAAELHRAAIVIDGHNDGAMWILDSGFDLGMDGADPRKKSVEPWMLLMRFLTPPPGAELRTHTDLHRLERGGVDAQFFSIFADPRGRDPGEYRTRAIEMIEALIGQFVRHAGRLTLAVSASDIREAAAAGKVAGLMGLEGGHAIEDELENVENFYDLGVRYMTLTWSNTNGWADSSGDTRRHGGLTDFGRQVVREMNRLGMLVDVSHVSDETFWDVIEVARAPVIASHSSARALVDVPRNLSDDMLRAVAANGGVVMVNFGGSFIDPAKAGTATAALDILLHLGPSPVPLSDCSIRSITWRACGHRSRQARIRLRQRSCPRARGIGLPQHHGGRSRGYPRRRPARSSARTFCVCSRRPGVAGVDRRGRTLAARPSARRSAVA
jgi:microsomal dipeptidase-like Zn-dependent dipeptidase